MPQAYDCWAQITSRNGFRGDELVSSLQKLIRRGDAEQACRIAYEMYLTGEALENYMWLRLSVISVEDIGPASPYLAGLVCALDTQRRAFPYGSGDRMLFAIHAIRTLCGSEKTRSNDMLLNVIMREFERGAYPTIPDVALDMHTRRGQAMGRGLEHFLREAAQVSPAWTGKEPDYHGQLLEELDKERKK